MAKRDKKLTALLRILKESNRPLTSTQIADHLNSSGIDISERSIRLYLGDLDKKGLVISHGRRGKTISEAGSEYLRSEQLVYHIGYLSAKIDQMTYAMNFDLARRSGKVVVNVSLVDPHLLHRYCDAIGKVFELGYAMGNRVMLLGPGEELGDIQIPEDKVGFCTVCSITLNGVLLKHGIPTSSRFGGLLFLNKGKPERFVEVIHYDATSIDPLEVFIRSGMTDYWGAISRKTGKIGASFRELPADSREMVTHIAQHLDEIGLGAFMKIGLPGQSVLDIPVSEGRIGALVIGGLNPIAILEEKENRVVSKAMSGLVEFTRLFTYKDLATRLKHFV
ncbi:MAG: DUF128 domain-containing protein [Chitinivibrionales bacterium]|nr:DUF128 domain-containing protein [Chitinivibrionales bacterium]